MDTKIKYMHWHFFVLIETLVGEFDLRILLILRRSGIKIYVNRQYLMIELLH